MRHFPDDGARAFPRNESELLQGRPPDHRDGVFPRRLLLPGERILFETRPAPVWQSGWTVGIVAFLFASTVIATVVALVLSVAPGFEGAGAAAMFVGAGAVGVLFWGAILAVLLRSRQSTAFALTDRRVLSVEGFWSSDFRFAGWGQVQRLYLPASEPSSVVFEYRVATDPKTITEPAYRMIAWTALRSGPRTYHFAQTAFAVEAARRAVEARELRQRTELLAARVECAYCGNLVLIDSADRVPLTCPRCSAPLPALVSPAATPARPRSDGDQIPYLRPVVFLARDAIDWFRTMPVLWAVLTVLLPLLVVLAPTTTGGTSTGYTAIALAFLIVVPLSFVLWAQSIRKWATVVRTLRASLPADSVWQARVAEPLRRRLSIAVVGYVASIVLLAVTLSLIAELPAFGASFGVPSPVTVVVVAGGFLSVIAAIVIGQFALVTSYTEIATGSGVREIVETLRRGRRVAGLSLLAGFWPAGVVLFLLSIGWGDVSDAYWLVPGIAGPLALLLGIGWILHGLGSWTDLAERVYTPESAISDLPYPGLGGPQGLSEATGTAPGSLAVGVRSLVRWRVPRTRWALLTLMGTGAVVGIVALSAAGVLTPWLDLIPRAPGPPPPPLPPPIVIAAAGTTWSIPVGHYEYESFWLKGNATLSGTFNASGPVVGYVMDNLDYVRWTVIGTVVSDQFTTGNVTSGEFHLAMDVRDRWYVIVLNQDPVSTIDVTWSTDCVAVYTR